MIRIKLIVFCFIIGITHLHAQVTANFTSTATSGCAPLSVTFTDKTVGKPTYWSWGFSDGQISRQQNPTIVFKQPGTYSVSLLVKDAAGNVNAISHTDYITVFPSPGTNFTSDIQTGCAPATINFQDISTPGQGSITSWSWDFGDGSPVSAAQNPAHQYMQQGYFNVSLTATNSGGCSSTAKTSRFIRVVPGVTPDFTFNQTSPACSAPFNINFVNQTSGPGTLTYAWDLDNTSTSTAANPSTTYPTNNTYNIKLTATSSLGCSASTTKPISFQAGKSPVIDAPDSACVNTPISFTNASSPAALSSSWDFGDATTSTATNPQKSYSALNTYTVTLYNNYGPCLASTTKSIKIIDAAVPAFAANSTFSCKAPFSVQFTDQTPGAVTRLWDFGDGTTSTDPNPTHTYNSLAKYNVSLTVTTGSGCSGTTTKNEFIKMGAPDAIVYPGTADGCTGIVLHPVLSISTVDGVGSLEWSAPGATPSTATGANPGFTYSAEGNYDLSVKLTTAGGCVFQKTFAKAVTIGDPIPAKFTVSPTTSCARQPVTFTFDPPSQASRIDKWLWQFGDRSNSTTGPSVVHRYADTGYNDVILAVTHHGCTLRDTAKKVVYINPPLAGFRYTIDCIDRHKVTFSDTSKLDAAKTYNFEWTFGDGTTSTLQNPPQHTYPDLNPKTVRLIVKDPGGCADTVTSNVILQPINPSFTIAPNPSCKNGLFTLTSTSTPAAAIDSFTWTVNTVVRTVANPVFTTGIPDTGKHTITLAITDRGGCTYTANNDILITGPSASFAPGTGGCKNSPVAFNDLSKPYNADPANVITKWSWNFGDGNSASGRSISHTYADTGTYDITLAVEDAKGCTDTFRIANTEKITSVKAGFFADTVYCPSSLVPFTDTSRGININAWHWDFGDGAQATIQNPTHAYASNGQYYDVKLKVADATGCADSVTYSKYMHITKPVAAFDMEDSVGICIPLQTSFIPAGKYYDSLYWNFGDGTTSTLDTTTHFYNNYGQQARGYAFNALLILQGKGGCRDTAARKVYVYLPNDVSKLAFTPTSQCDSAIAKFTITAPQATRFTLFFGDGTADSTNNPTPEHLYDLPATYAPQIVLQDSSGCVVPINNGTIKILGATPFFTVDKKAFCDTSTVLFQSIYPIPSNDGVGSVAWDFADGSPSFSGTPAADPDDPFLKPSHFYNQPGIHHVTMKVTTNSGCTESYSDTVHVWQIPHPVIATDGSLCTGPIQFRGDLTEPNLDSVSWRWSFGNNILSAAKDPLVNLPAGPVTAHLRTSVTFGCSDTTSQQTLINPLPEIKGPKEVSTPVGIPVTLPLTYISNVNTWSWSPSTYLDCADCPNPVSTPTFNTTYQVTATDVNGCVNTDTILVKTLCGGDNYFMPNTFSPNNDGVNDYFYPRGRGLHNIQSMRIFNRWGQMIFERKDFPANSASMGWDGTSNGKPAPPDAYVYIVEVVCINAQVIALRGDVTLIR